MSNENRAKFPLIYSESCKILIILFEIARSSIGLRYIYGKLLLSLRILQVTFATTHEQNEINLSPDGPNPFQLELSLCQNRKSEPQPKREKSVFGRITTWPPKFPSDPIKYMATSFLESHYISIVGQIVALASSHKFAAVR